MLVVSIVQPCSHNKVFSEYNTDVFILVIIRSDDGFNNVTIYDFYFKKFVPSSIVEDITDTINKFISIDFVTSCFIKKMVLQVA